MNRVMTLMVIHFVILLVHGLNRVMNFFPDHERSFETEL